MRGREDDTGLSMATQQQIAKWKRELNKNMEFYRRYPCYRIPGMMLYWPVWPQCNLIISSITVRNLVHSYVSIHTICSFFKVIIFFCSYVKVIYNNFYVLLLKSLSFSVHLLLPMQAIEQLPKGAHEPGLHAHHVVQQKTVTYGCFNVLSYFPEAHRVDKTGRSCHDHGCKDRRNQEIYVWFLEHVSRQAYDISGLIQRQPQVLPLKAITGQREFCKRWQTGSECQFRAHRRKFEFLQASSETRRICSCRRLIWWEFGIEMAENDKFVSWKVEFNRRSSEIGSIWGICENI